jgi:uncharacterized protein Yka (UPF0111/DUF47 family)
VETAHFSEMVAFTNQPTQRFNPKEHNQKFKKFISKLNSSSQELTHALTAYKHSNWQNPEQLLVKCKLIEKPPMFCHLL